MALESECISRNVVTSTWLKRSFASIGHRISKISIGFCNYAEEEKYLIVKVSGIKEISGQSFHITLKKQKYN